MFDLSFPDLTAKSRQIIEQFTNWFKIAVGKFKNDLVAECTAFTSGSLTIDKETYTKTEITNLLHGQLCISQGLIDTQIVGIMTATAELLHALLREVDQQRLVLQIDTVATLNKGGMVDVIPHGKELLKGPVGRLAPLTIEEAGGRVAQQLEESNNQIRELRRRLQQVTDAYTQMMNNRSNEVSVQHSMRNAMTEKDSFVTELTQHCHSQDDDLQHLILQLRREVSEAKRELTQRLSRSTQYQQIKDLLAKRNTQLKWMRDQLRKYDPLFNMNDIDDLVVEED